MLEFFEKLFLNKYSIGIEINNPGHSHKYKAFSYVQIHSLIAIKISIKKFNIKKRMFWDIQIFLLVEKKILRKISRKTCKVNLCNWHNLNEKKIKKFRNLKLSNFEEKTFFNNLHNIGYLRVSVRSNKNKKDSIIKAFQRKFRQDLINGKTDQECLLISKNLQ